MSQMWEPKTVSDIRKKGNKNNSDVQMMNTWDALIPAILAARNALIAASQAQDIESIRKIAQDAITQIQTSLDAAGIGK